MQKDRPLANHIKYPPAAASTTTFDLVSTKIDVSAAIGLGQTYYGEAVTLNYNNPKPDPRTPDIIVTPNVGVTYSGSTSKLPEHGGFAHDDTNVILLLSNPGFHAKMVRTSVETAQVAPTILKALNIDPAKLDAVRIEGTSILPDSTIW